MPRPRSHYADAGEPRFSTPKVAMEDQFSRRRHRVVIVGTGFGGLFAAKSLRRVDAEVTVIGQTSHHLFQPLLYQVATGILAEGEIAPSTRMILKRQANASVQLGEVTQIDLAHRTVSARLGERVTVTSFDSLIVAAGAQQSYFGNDHFVEHAPGLKTIDDALELRGRILKAFEEAELCDDPDERARLLTFVVVGAGPTGVEMAGQIAELARHTLVGTFTRIDPRDARIVIVDAAASVLPPFGSALGQYAAARLKRLGVEVILGCAVVAVDAAGLLLRDGDGSQRRIEAACKIWSAGVSASPLGRQLATQSTAELDRAGRVRVNDDLTLPGYDNVFVVGDMMALAGLPGVAQVAIQGGRHAARRVSALVAAEKAGVEPRPARSFEYRDKGSMATIARFGAIAKIGRVEVTGVVAWAMWLAVHVAYIVGFRSRIATLVSWAWTFTAHYRGQLTTTQQQTDARNTTARLHQVLGDEPPSGNGISRASLDLS